MVQSISKVRILFILVLFSWGLSADIYSQETRAEVRFSDYPFLPFYEWKKLKHPEIFQGNRREDKYFEGWYFKMVSGVNSGILSVIPGISISEDGEEQHAFIQLIDGNTTETWYFRFPIEDFYFSTIDFAVRIGPNYFSADRLFLDLDQDGMQVKGEVRMGNKVGWPSAGVLNPGIMGWYRYVPFMQCYHGVVSMDHALSGKINLGGKNYIFDKGRGYIEKDWGSSMPSSWIWIQTNHFETPGISFMLSVADVPWLGKSFTGFLGFFLKDGEVYNFASYTGAKLLFDSTSESKIHLRILDSQHEYIVEANRDGSGVLMAPSLGSMDRRISESIQAKLVLTIKDLKGKVLYIGKSKITGLELVGDLRALKDNQK